MHVCVCFCVAIAIVLMSFSTNEHHESHSPAVFNVMSFLSKNITYFWGVSNIARPMQHSPYLNFHDQVCMYAILSKWVPNLPTWIECRFGIEKFHDDFVSWQFWKQNEIQIEYFGI